MYKGRHSHSSCHTDPESFRPALYIKPWTLWHCDLPLSLPSTLLVLELLWNVSSSDIINIKHLCLYSLWWCHASSWLWTSNPTWRTHSQVCPAETLWGSTRLVCSTGAGPHKPRRTWRGGRAGGPSSSLIPSVGVYLAPHGTWTTSLWPPCSLWRNPTAQIPGALRGLGRGCHQST